MRQNGKLAGMVGVLSAVVAVACSSSSDNNAGAGGYGGQRLDAGAFSARGGSIDGGVADVDESGAKAADIVSCSGATVAQIIQVRMPYFDPPSATVSDRAVVEFKNTDPDAKTHTATSGEVNGGTPSPDGTFDTGPIAPGASVCVRLDFKGIYPFYCKSNFDSMQGEITVQ